MNSNAMARSLWLFLVLNFFKASHAYFADWSPLAGEREPMCVPIPANLSLCHNIGYTKMRLPNLLDHDTVQEVSQQASSWVPLMKIKCHDDTQLFLCSLFAPVCLERPIYPCRSLCQKVKTGCEGIMATYGFPWPSMLDCDKFPLDNDMCIASQTVKEGGEEPNVMKVNNNNNYNNNNSSRLQEEEDKKITTLDEDIGVEECKAKSCHQASTYENILDNFCHADFVVKMKFRRAKKNLLFGKKVQTVFKTWRGTPDELRKLTRPKLKLSASDECCSKTVVGLSNNNKKHNEKYLVMGKKEGRHLVATFILPWTKSDELKRARRMFKKIDCSKLVETSQQMMAEALASHSLFSRDSVSKNMRRRSGFRGRNGGKRRRRHPKNKRKNKKRRNKKQRREWSF